jgi:hypothetical protein
MPVTIDKFEYATDLAAQAAWRSSAAASHYPVAQNNTYVKSTTRYNDSYYPHNATNPANSLIGGNNQGWVAWNGAKTNQRFHIDLGDGHIINRIYYENYHNSGAKTSSGVQNFTLWGSNEATAFAELTYATDTNWTQLTTSQSTFDKHVAANQADPKYIDVTNTTSYRYYAFKFADTYGSNEGDNYMGLRRVELQIASGMVISSESTIKEEGDYSMKVVAPQTTSLNRILTRTCSPTLNFTDQDEIKFKIRSSRTGTNLKIGFHDSGGTTTESNIAISSADTWEEKTIDISAVANANKDAIDSIIITITNADAENIIYLDEMLGYADGEGTGAGGVSRARIVNGV